MAMQLEELTGDVVFAEGPRWRDGRLWFSDMHGEAVYSVSLDGDRRTELQLPGRRPSGLGFLPDGSLLVVSMLDRQILRWDGRHADDARRPLRTGGRRMQRHARHRAGCRVRRRVSGAGHDAGLDLPRRPRRGRRRGR